MTWLFRLVLFFLIFALIRSLLSLFFRKSAARRPLRDTQTTRGTKAIGSEAVKDPQCGTYVDKGIALPVKSGQQTLYFCSEECRREYFDT